MTREERMNSILEMVKAPPAPSTINGCRLADALATMLGSEPFDPHMDIIDLEVSVSNEATLRSWYPNYDVPSEDGKSRNTNNDVATHEILLEHPAVRLTWKDAPAGSA